MTGGYVNGGCNWGTGGCKFLMVNEKKEEFALIMLTISTERTLAHYARARDA